MIELIDHAIKELASCIGDYSTPDEALKYTQAISNLSHSKSILMGLREDK